MAEFESPGRQKVREAMDRAVKEMGAPSIVVQVQDDNGTWFGSAGLADTVTGARRVPGEQLHTGSISKAYTAATVLQLVAEGRLGIDDTVDKWLPGVMARNGYDGTKVTIRHLLSNTSGLFATGMALEFQRRYMIRSALARHRFDVWQPEDVLDLAQSEPPVGQPGERFWYSNGGFAFAAAIVEQVTGNSFESEVDRTVVRPLGLKNTFMRHREETGYRGRHPRAYSKVFLKEGVRPEDVRPDNWPSMLEDPNLPPLDVTELNTSAGWGAANAVASLDELMVFFRAMITGALLPPDQHRDMWTTVSTKGSHWLANARYGLGLYELTLSNGLTLRGGTGQSMGTCTFTMGTTDGKHMLAIHTNNDWATFPAFDEIIKAEFGASGFALEL
ncbi:serine hydrolase domain-containing protein [Streptoalloteichus hindustanus]|uniref:D-alanyl-D-alanine carboxypeptidase n=1 Tax=Streptoalloteichus hindustanus TaxID=2017 RepID=A0A1M5IG65_STRHI|nr:serine hydrolase domain-containing protein [Streptoalloteichus hindustanus]SHG27049.1 D-alanyl-D-alanine carboxypeptidase [Streptoalloteichus hindustanus]